MIFVQPTRGLDIGAIENIHKQIISERDAGRAILLISLEPVSYTHLEQSIDGRHRQIDIDREDG